MKLEKGKKYTLFAVGETLPMCYRSEIVVKDINPDGRPIFSHKGKRKMLYLKTPKEDMLVVEGWGLKPQLKSEIVVDGCSTWSMDGTINFGDTNVGEVKALVKRNLNENFTRYDKVTIANGTRNVPITEDDTEMMLMSMKKKSPTA